ncbi:hypothetical protein BAE44_0017573 [Dichanthelium oligosanthes]|uniref:Major facilitator superfamily (MFS) profile domain-containing protein n=1 Tax=Dichanthelium oligosanthes TaxID=888268 RepID=A0A1E5V8A6_9POAL|nr:hypothetical protein BAE44_0017573 [Dichanthelium oligosanthes]
MCHMKAGIFFFFFAVWLVAMTAFVYLLLPETKGVLIEQVAGLGERTGSEAGSSGPNPATRARRETLKRYSAHVFAR